MIVVFGHGIFAGIIAPLGHFLVGGQISHFDIIDPSGHVLNSAQISVGFLFP